MIRIVLALISIFLLPNLSVSQEMERDTFQLYFMGGQSNMDGFGKNAELPASAKKTIDHTMIFHGNPAPDGSNDGGIGKWTKLQPGHGYGFSTDGITNKRSDQFGPELFFAKKLKEYDPNQKIAIIKYSRAGTSLDSLAAAQFGSWEPDYRGSKGINQYDHCLKAIDQALRSMDINQDGKEDILVPAGILWMQGESDAAYSEEIANNYFQHLKRLMDLLRAALHKNDIPVVLGKISDSWNNDAGKVWKHGELVQYAQEKYARTDRMAAIVRSTRYYKYSDTWHYDTEGFIDLGEKFAEAIYLLRQSRQSR